MKYRSEICDDTAKTEEHYDVKAYQICVSCVIDGMWKNSSNLIQVYDPGSYFHFKDL